MNVITRVFKVLFGISELEKSIKIEIEKGFKEMALDFTKLQTDVDNLGKQVVPALQTLDTNLQVFFKQQSDLIAQLQASINSSGDTTNQPIIDALDTNLQNGVNALNTLASDLGHIITPAPATPPPAANPLP